ncbi:gluconate 2-dehydrogenase subunit 3 family protein [Sulfurimonas sp. HSL-1716]|uniref:gluconate 2-dehydrogenase subunit 3 family protein n=1 Tax=Hydrocurvibacter sulfurireducens TaxID=3131937 RepID=UPI0031F977DE
MKRRKFIAYSAVLLSSTVFAKEAGSYALQVSVLKEPYQTISMVINDLFPSGVGMPNPHSFNVIGFLKAVMQDKRVPAEKKKILRNGTGWINQKAQNHYIKNYIELSPDQRQKILKTISQKQWGDTWLWYLMNYTLEAMFSDPVYGANINETGWLWLDYKPGLPRPLKVNRYV